MVIFFCATTRKTMDVDGKRATALLLQHGNQRILTPREVRELHRAILHANSSAHEKGVALSIVQDANRGQPLSWPETLQVLDAIDVIWKEKPMKFVGQGVKDLSVLCPKCDASGKRCVGCSGCTMDFEKTGGIAENPLAGGHRVYLRTWNDPSDCGCSS